MIAIICINYNAYRNLKAYYEYGRVKNPVARYDAGESPLPWILNEELNEAAEQKMEGGDLHGQKRFDTDNRRKYAIVLLDLLGFKGIDDSKKLDKVAMQKSIDDLMVKLGDKKYRPLLNNLVALRPKCKKIDLKEKRFDINMAMINGILLSVYGIKIKRSNRHKETNDYHIENLYFTPVIETEHGTEKITVKLHDCVKDDDVILVMEEPNQQQQDQQLEAAPIN